MKTEEYLSLNSDKTTDFSFYVMAGSLLIGLLTVIGYIVYSLFG